MKKLNFGQCFSQFLVAFHTHRLISRNPVEQAAWCAHFIDDEAEVGRGEVFRAVVSRARRGVCAGLMLSISAHGPRDGQGFAFGHIAGYYHQILQSQSAGVPFSPKH